MSAAVSVDPVSVTTTGFVPVSMGHWETRIGVFLSVTVNDSEYELSVNRR